jgi:Zn-finger nucleic acid-binding protein
LIRRSLRPFIEFLLKEHNEIPYAKIKSRKKPGSADSISEPSRTCPRCSQPMTKFNYAYDSNILLDKCASCEGLWAEAEELYRLAVFKRGNPKLDALGKALVKDKRRQAFLGLTVLAKLFPGSRWLRQYKP